MIIFLLSSTKLLFLMVGQLTHNQKRNKITLCDSKFDCYIDGHIKHCVKYEIHMANDTGSVTKSICSLPEWYAEVHPGLLQDERAQPPDMSRPEGADGCVLSRTLTDKYEWLDQVKVSVNQE